jgi:hypothetical protein
MKAGLERIKVKRSKVAESLRCHFHSIVGVENLIFGNAKNQKRTFVETCGVVLALARLEKESGRLFSASFSSTRP